MKVLLTPEAITSLTGLQERFRRYNEFVDTSSGPFVSLLIRILERELPNQVLQQLAPQMVSAKVKQKVMRERLAKLADKIDEDQLARLENRLSKARTFAHEFGENS